LIKIIIKGENFKWHLEAFASELFILWWCSGRIFQNIFNIHFQQNVELDLLGIIKILQPTMTLPFSKLLLQFMPTNINQIVNAEKSLRCE